MLDFIGEGLFLRGIGGRRHSVSPLALFAGGVIGVWFDPSDHATSFEDVAGTIPATLPGQPIGLRLDKSKGLVLGPELLANGGFDTDAGWTKGAGWAINGGVASLDGTQTTNSYFYQPIITAGKSYKITVNVLNKAGLVNVSAGNLGSPFALNLGVNSFILHSAGNANFLVYGAGGVTVTIDNISVRELPSYHAAQPVAASRPTLARHPKGGRRNLLDKTEDLLSTAWVRGIDLLVIPSPIAPPPGCNQAFRVTKSGPSNIAVTQVITAFGATGATKSIWARTVSGTGTIALNGYYGFAKHQVTLTEEWQRFSAPVDMGETGGGSYYAVDFRYGNLTEVIIAAPQYDAASVATPYQKVTSQYDVTEASDPDRFIESYDGVDDHLLTTLKPTLAGSIIARFNAGPNARVVVGSHPAGDGRAYLGLSTDGRLAGGIGLRDTSIIVAGPDIRGGWHTGAITWDGTTVKLYLDGAEVYSAAQSGAVNTTVPMMIGALNNGSSAVVLWAGLVSHALALGRVMTPAEITSLTTQWSA